MTYELPMPTASTLELIHHAYRVLEQIYKPCYKYKKAGVMITGIEPRNRIQLSLLTPSLNHEISNTNGDHRPINSGWGREIIRFVVTGIKQSWRMRQSRKSYRFTTSWTEIPVVKATFPNPKRIKDVSNLFMLLVVVLSMWRR